MSISSTDTRLSLNNKELPTTKWRRDRRIRLSSEYHGHEGTAAAAAAAAAGLKPLSESNQSAHSPSHSPYANNEIPLDMSLSSKPPPPPYREPLPGSAFAVVRSLNRPSVITQAPRKDLESNQENHSRLDSGSSGPVNYSRGKISISLDPIASILTHSFLLTAPESISMIDPVIDEHFRRSLGADYMHLFEAKSKSAESSPKPSPPLRVSPSLSVRSTNSLASSTSSSTKVASPKAKKASKQTINVEMSVDDHFAKALGATWKKLQEADKSAPSPSTSNRSDDDDYDEHDDSA